MKSGINYFIFYLFCFLGISCNHLSHHRNEVKYHAGLNLRAKDRFYFNIVSSLQSIAEVDDKKHESGRTVEICLIYEVLHETVDSIAIKVTYDKLHVMMKNDGIDKDIIAKPSGEEADPMDKFFGSLLGGSVIVYLDHKGDVLQVTGYDDISDKILASLNLKEGSVRNNIRQQMNKMVGGEFVRNTIQQSFKIFPDKAIAVDDNWTSQGSPSDELGVGMNTTFTLNSLKNNIARIGIKSVLNDKKDGDSINVLGYQALASLDGGQKGHFDVDTVTGMLMSGESTLSLEGKIQMMGREIPVKITSEKKMEGKKIN